MYFANFAQSLLKTCSRLKVVKEEIQEPEDVRDLPFLFIMSSSFQSAKIIPYSFLCSYSSFLRLNNHSIIIVYSYRLIDRYSTFFNLILHFFG